MVRVVGTRGVGCAVNAIITSAMQNTKTVEIIKVVPLADGKNPLGPTNTNHASGFDELHFVSREVISYWLVSHIILIFICCQLKVEYEYVKNTRG